MTLFEECIEVLGKNAYVLSENETKNMFIEFEKMYPFTKWGRIDWEKVDKKVFLKSNDEIMKHLKSKINMSSDIVYIMWDECTLPVIKSNLHLILNVIDDVTAVSFDTWIYCPSDRYVIEFYHEGEIVLGII